MAARGPFPDPPDPLCADRENTAICITLTQSRFCSKKYIVPSIYECYNMVLSKSCQSFRTLKLLGNIGR